MIDELNFDDYNRKLARAALLLQEGIDKTVQYLVEKLDVTEEQAKREVYQFLKDIKL